MLPAFSPYLGTPEILKVMTVAIIFLIVVIAIRLGIGSTLFGGRFIARPPNNYNVQKLYRYLVRRLESDFGSGALLMCQVSYGEFLGSKNVTRFRSINAKRADFVVVDKTFKFIAVIEYQGQGHYGNTLFDRLDAHKRDRVRRRALKSVGIPLFEIPARFTHISLAEICK